MIRTAIGLAATALAIQAVPAIAQDAQPAVMGLPPVLKPTVMPYFLCRQAEAGVPVVDGEGNPLEYTGPAGDCATVREEARVRGERVLRDYNLGRSRADRFAMVETVLDRIDAFSDGTRTSQGQTPQG